MDLDKKKEKRKREVKELVLKLQDFDNPENQDFALDELTDIFPIYREEHDLIEPILEILQYSKIVNFRIKAIKALIKIYVKNDKVMPIIIKVFHSDRSIRVKSIIPSVFYFYQKESKELVKESLAFPKGEARLNTLKILGYFTEEKDFAITILKNEYIKDQSFNEKLNCLFSLLRIEGLESKWLEETKKFLKDSKLPKEDLFVLNLEFKSIIDNLKNKKLDLDKEKKIKEKWYKRKDFLKNSFTNLETFDYYESGVELQSRYVDFIIMILKGRVATLVSLESLINFPGKNLPGIIKEVIESDFDKFQNTRDKMNDLYKKSSDDYSNYSEFFQYMLRIDRLSVYNLKYIILKNNPKMEIINDPKLGDVFRKELIKYPYEIDTSYKELLEKFKQNSKIIEQITKTNIVDFTNENYKFQNYILSQELCWHFANLEAFLYDSLEFLAIDINKNKYKKEKTVHFTYKGKMEEFCVSEFEKNNFPERINYLIKKGFLDKSWLSNKENSKKINCFRILRNSIIHYNGRLTDKYQDAYCKERYPNSEKVTLDIQMIEDLIELIIRLSKTVYNSISKVLKK